MDISNNKKRPNLIIVLTDGMRPRDLSMFGYDVETDSHIKRIANESAVFMNAFSTSGASDTADTSIFSGQFPTTSGFIHQNPRTEGWEIEMLRKNKFWLPLHLQKLGYKTISMTSQHLWFKKGYDYCMTKEGAGAGKYLSRSWILRKFLLGLPNWAYVFGKKMTSVRLSPKFITARQIIDETIEKIDETDKPFYMYMQLLDAHCPYGGVDTPKVESKTPISGVLDKIENPAQREYVKKRFFDSDTKSLEESKAKLDASIISMDKEIGRLVDYLKKKDLWDNTIFVIISDHGENYGEHGNYFCRGGLYDPSVHIPLIMHLPGLPSKKINSMVANIDVSATILDYMGDKKDIDGKSLIPLIKGEVEDNYSFRDKIFMADGFCKDRFAVRTKDRKLIITEDGKCFLCGMEHNDGKIEEYDLSSDSEELKNIYERATDLENVLRGQIDNLERDVDLGEVTSTVVNVER